MGKVIHFQTHQRPVPDSLITAKPWEFRRSFWDNHFFLQMRRSQSDKLERQRGEMFMEGETRIGHLPPHYVLKNGMDNTIRALFRYRKDEGKMREVYYLAGLIDCMINQVTPVLRTDLLRDMYKRVMTMRSVLHVNWYGTIHQVLLPLDGAFYNEPVYKDALEKAASMKELYRFIRDAMNEMFDILSREYTFFSPGRSI